MTNAPQRLLIDQRIGIQARLYAPDARPNEASFQIFWAADAPQLDSQLRNLWHKQFLPRLFSEVDGLCRSDNSTPVKCLQNARIRIRQAAMKRRPRLRRPGQ